MGKVVDIFKEEHIDNLQGHMAIGHNRYSTTGSSFLRNAQPFRSESILGPIVLAHNGNLTNAGSPSATNSRKRDTSSRPPSIPR